MSLAGFVCWLHRHPLHFPHNVTWNLWKTFKLFSVLNKSLSNQACSGPYWENISPSGPRADIFPVRPSRLVNKIYVPQHFYLRDMSCSQGLIFLEFGHMEHKSHLDISCSLRPHKQDHQNKNHLKTLQYHSVNFCWAFSGRGKRKKSEKAKIRKSSWKIV